MSNSTNYKPALTSYGRVFLITGRARPDHSPQYASHLKMSGPSQSFGDITKIEMPDPIAYGKFIEVGQIRGSTERATSSLIGRFPAALRSQLQELAVSGCPFDVQLHIGECTDPSNFNTFNKTIIFEDVLISSYSTEDLGALQSDEDAKIDETAEISIKKMYESVPLTFARKASDLITNEVTDVTIGGEASCGSCSIENTGCGFIFAVTKAAGGSPGTPPDIVYSIDGGVTFKAEDVDTLLATEDADAVAVLGEYVLVVSNAAGSVSYAALEDFLLGNDPAFTEITTGIVAGAEPNDIWSIGNVAFVVGDMGYVYLLSNVSDGFTVLDAGDATTHALVSVHAFSQDCAIAGGNHGSIVYTINQTSWALSPSSPVGLGVTINAVWMKSATEWWIGTSNGHLYYTINSGVTWTEKVLPGTTPTAVTDISFASESIMYVSATVSAHGKLFRSFNGGSSFTVLPEKTGSIPLSDTYASIFACKYDVDFVVAGGLGDNASDGILIVGQD